MTPRLVICRSNPIAPDPRVEKVARTLKQAGYGVLILGWDRTGNFPREEQIRGVTCLRLQIKANSPTGIYNIPYLIRWQWGLFSWLIRHRKDYDLIHACDFDTILPALACAKLYKKKVIYDIFDVYAYMLRRIPKMIKAMIHRVDLWAINQADGVIQADDSRMDQIAGARPKCYTVVYNSPLDLLGTFERKPGSPPGYLRVSYIGLLQFERGLFDLIEVISKHEEWELDLGGSGPEEAEIRDEIQSYPNIHWHGQIPYAKTLDLNAASDAMIAIFNPDLPNHRYSSSNKLFEAMMLKKPIIVARNTNMDRIVQIHECGIVINYGNRSDLEAALHQLAQDPDLRQQLGENGRLGYEQVYNWEIMQSRLQDFYAEILRS